MLCGVMCGIWYMVYGVCVCGDVGEDMEDMESMWMEDCVRMRWRKRDLRFCSAGVGIGGQDGF